MRRFRYTSFVVCLGFRVSPTASTDHRWRAYYGAGRIKEISEYCETDVVNTYRAWLRYELFRGTLSLNEYDQSEANLVSYISGRGDTKPPLMTLIERRNP